MPLQSGIRRAEMARHKNPDLERGMLFIGWRGRGARPGLATPAGDAVVGNVDLNLKAGG